jgi:solute:Na+ symporter, SSS family
VTLSFAYKIYAPEIAFMNRVGYVFLICLGAAIMVSLTQRKSSTSTIDVSNIDYSTSRAFNVASLVVMGILVTLYTIFW